MRITTIYVVFVLLAMSLSGCGGDDYNSREAKFEGKWRVISENKSGIIPGPITDIPNYIFFDENEGIATYVSQVNHTVNGGKEWTVVHEFQDLAVFSFTLDEGQDVWGVGAKWVDGEIRAPAVVRSKDKGRTWFPLEIDSGNQKKVFNEPSGFRDICFTSPDSAWLVSSVGLIEATVREQTINIEKVIRTEEELSNMSCSSVGVVVGVGRKGAIYRYDDRGLSRLHQPSEFTFSKVKQIDNDIWLMGYKTLDQNSNSVDTGMSGIVLFSADRGATWENRTPKEIRSFNDIDLRNGEGWLTGSDGSLFYSNDNGESWRDVVVPTKSNLYNIFFLDKGNIWIGGINDTVLKYYID